MSSSRTFVNGVILAVFAFVCIAAMEVFAVNIGQPNPLSHDYTVSALFSDADGLPTAADIRVAGVGVGKVTNISHDASYPGYTVVTMDIHDDRANPIYQNGAATIRPKTLLGEKYVDLVIGDATSEAVPAGGFMPPRDGAKSVSADEIFNAFDKPTRTAQQKVLQALDTALQGRSSDVSALLPQLDTVFQNLLPVAKVYEQDNATVDSVFTNLDTVMQTLADEHTQLADFLHNGSVALGAINARDGSLVTALSEATRVQDELTSVLDPTATQQQQSITKITPAINGLHALVSQAIYPQAACGNKPCGLDELLAGTLNGQINYPNDQLTVSGVCAKGKPGPDSCEGEYVTNQYDSMFSVPSNGYTNPSAGQHSALSIVASENCDTVAATATNPLPTLVGVSLGNSLQPIITQACKAAGGNAGASFQTNPAASGSAMTAAMEGLTP